VHSTSEQSRRILAALLFAAPVAYAAYLGSVVVHEVLGHGLAALAVGGEFRGFVIHADGLGWARVTFVGHEATVLAAGAVVGAIVGAIAFLIARRTRTSSPFVSLALLLFAAMSFEDAGSYSFWGAVYARPPSDFGRIVVTMGDGARAGIAVIWGVVWVASAVAWIRELFRWIEDRFGPFSGRGAMVLFLCLAVPLSGFWLLLDWDQLIPGSGFVPPLAGIALDVVVLATLITRRRGVVEPCPMTASRWRSAVLASWIGSACFVGVVLGMFGGHGVG